MDFTPDSTPLAVALTKIAAIVDRSESDPQEMRNMLWAIKDVIEDATDAYRANVMEAQKAETAALRASIAAQ